MDKYHVIKRPMLTEKSTQSSSELGRFVFEVDRKANKYDIKSAVESIYKVSVVKISTMLHKSRQKRNKHGWTGGVMTKKAVVRLKDGQTIELF